MTLPTGSESLHTVGWIDPTNSDIEVVQPPAVEGRNQRAPVRRGAVALPPPTNPPVHRVFRVQAAEKHTKTDSDDEYPGAGDYMQRVHLAQQSGLNAVWKLVTSLKTKKMCSVMVSNMSVEAMTHFGKVTHLLANSVEEKSTRARMSEAVHMPALQVVHSMRPAEVKETVVSVQLGGIKHLMRVTDLLKTGKKQRTFTDKSSVAQMEQFRDRCWEVVNAVEEACPPIARTKQVQ